MPRNTSTVLVVGDSTVAYCYEARKATSKEKLEAQLGKFIAYIASKGGVGLSFLLFAF